MYLQDSGITIDSMPESLNAPWPIDVILPYITIPFNEVHSEKHPLDIDVTSEGNSILVMFSQPSKAKGPIVFTESGIHTSTKCFALKKAPQSMVSTVSGMT